MQRDTSRRKKPEGYGLFVIGMLVETAFALSLIGIAAIMCMAIDVVVS